MDKKRAFFLWSALILVVVLVAGSFAEISLRGNGSKNVVAPRSSHLNKSKHVFRIPKDEFQMMSAYPGGPDTFTNDKAKITVLSSQVIQETTGQELIKFVITFKNKSQSPVNLREFIKNRVDVAQYKITAMNTVMLLHLNVQDVSQKLVPAHGTQMAVFFANVVKSKLSDKASDNHYVVGVLRKSGEKFAGGQNFSFVSQSKY